MLKRDPALRGVKVKPWGVLPKVIERQFFPDGDQTEAGEFVGRYVNFALGVITLKKLPMAAAGLFRHASKMVEAMRAARKAGRGVDRGLLLEGGQQLWDVVLKLSTAVNPIATIAKDVLGPEPGATEPGTHGGYPYGDPTLGDVGAHDAQASERLLGKFPERVRTSLQTLAEETGGLMLARRVDLSDDEAAEIAKALTGKKTVGEIVRSLPNGSAYTHDQIILIGHAVAKQLDELDTMIVALDAAARAGESAAQSAAREAAIGEQALRLGLLTSVLTESPEIWARAGAAYQRAKEKGSSTAAMQAVWEALGGNAEKFSEWVRGWRAIDPADEAARNEWLANLTKPTYWGYTSVYDEGLQQVGEDAVDTTAHVVSPPLHEGTSAGDSVQLKGDFGGAGTGAWLQLPSTTRAEINGREVALGEARRSGIMTGSQASSHQARQLAPGGAERAAAVLDEQKAHRRLLEQVPLWRQRYTEARARGSFDEMERVAQEVAEANQDPEKVLATYRRQAKEEREQGLGQGSVGPHSVVRPEAITVTSRQPGIGERVLSQMGIQPERRSLPGRPTERSPFLQEAVAPVGIAHGGARQELPAAFRGRPATSGQGTVPAAFLRAFGSLT